MTNIEEFKKKIRDKYIILDANILMHSFENVSSFRGFFELLKECNCDIIKFELVNFEFTRNDYQQQIIKLKEEFLEKINATDFPYKRDLIEEALSIAKIYSHQGVQKGKTSLVDCCIGAMLKQYPQKLFLATLNHSDFPIRLFDREYIFPIDAGNNVLPVAFYTFSEVKWRSLVEKLEKTNSKSSQKGATG